MKITRSTRCSLKFATAKKQAELKTALSEYGRVVNIFIGHFWKNGSPDKSQLLKPIVDLPQNTWLSARLRKVAAREAIDLVSSAKEAAESNKQQLLLAIKAIESQLKKLKPDGKRNRRKINRLHCLLKSKRMRHNAMKPVMPRHAGKSMTVSCTIAELQEAKEANGFDAWLHLASIGNKISLDLPIKYHKHFTSLAGKGKRLNAYIIHNNTVQLLCTSP